MAETGWNFAGSGEALFRTLRPMGAAAEKAMFRATGNVNTHKGIIFSLGTVSAFTLRALKRDHRVKGETILKEVGETVTPILEEDFPQDRSLSSPHPWGSPLHKGRLPRDPRGSDGWVPRCFIHWPAGFT